MPRRRETQPWMLERIGDVRVDQDDSVPEMRIRTRPEIWGMGHVRVALSGTTWRIIHCDRGAVNLFYDTVATLPAGEHQLSQPEFRRALGRHTFELPSEEAERETAELLAEIERSISRRAASGTGS